MHHAVFKVVEAGPRTEAAVLDAPHSRGDAGGQGGELDAAVGSGVLIEEEEFIHAAGDEFAHVDFLEIVAVDRGDIDDIRLEIVQIGVAAGGDGLEVHQAVATACRVPEEEVVGTGSVEVADDGGGEVVAVDRGGRQHVGFEVAGDASGPAGEVGQPVRTGGRVPEKQVARSVLVKVSDKHVGEIAGVDRRRIDRAVLHAAIREDDAVGTGSRVPEEQIVLHFVRSRRAIEVAADEGLEVAVNLARWDGLVDKGSQVGDEIVIDDGTRRRVIRDRHVASGGLHVREVDQECLVVFEVDIANDCDRERVGFAGCAREFERAVGRGVVAIGSGRRIIGSAEFDPHQRIHRVVERDGERDQLRPGGAFDDGDVTDRQAGGVVVLDRADRA